MKTKTYEKYDEFEKIDVGDLVSIIPNTSFITRSYTSDYRKQDKFVIGICVSVNDNSVEVVDEGIVDVNVTGITCIGDRITTSKIRGKAKAIRNDIDEIRVFDIKPVGKIIGLYNDYNKVKVLLGIE